MPSHARRMRAAILLSLLVVAAAATPASATLPGKNGQIAFQRFDADGHFQVWTANPDLTHQVQLTFGTDDGEWQSWSPDGSRIAFSSHRSDPDPTDDLEVIDVFTMRADGSGVRKITDSRGDKRVSPSWSPDGRWLRVLRGPRRLSPEPGHLPHRQRRHRTGHPRHDATRPGSFGRS